MSGWVAIPHSAIAAAGRDGRLAVLDLYERADRLGYGPLLVTDRELSDDWGVTRRGVWRILEALEAAGLVQLDRAEPGARRPSRVTVHPAVSRAVSQTRSQNGSQNGSQKNNGQTKEKDHRVPEREPDAEPDAEPSRADKDRARGSDKRPDQTRPDTKSVEAPPEPVERPTLQLVEPVAAPAPRLEDAPTVLDALPSWARRHRTRAAEVADGVIRCLEAIRQRPVASLQRCATDALHVTRLWESLNRPPMAELVAEVELVGRWAREAPGAENDIRGVRPDTGKVWSKDRSREVSTLLRPERWADRLADAQRWDEGEDRPRVRGEYRAEPRASPPKALPPGVDLMAYAFGPDPDPDMPF